MVNTVIDTANLAARVAGPMRLLSYTHDYASHSAYLSHFQNKVRIVPPPVEMDMPNLQMWQLSARDGGTNGQRVIGMAARLATEKGVEVLLNALPVSWNVYPDARVLYAGQYQNVLG